MITTSSINRIGVELTDEHNNALNIGGGVNSQSVLSFTTLILQELKDVRNRRLYIYIYYYERKE